jgi:hypothetical protein
VRKAPSFLARFAARVIHATHWVDLLHTKFDRARSLLVLAFATDQVFQAHNDVFHGSQGERAFLRPTLHDWERSVIQDFFPPPPARVLIGGAGMGRETFPIAEMGYSVVAFDPVPELVEGMRARKSPSVRVLRGGYEDLPTLTGEDGRLVDIREPLFDAAVIGWGSFSMLVTDAERVETLRRFAQVTRGPILASFWGSFWENSKFWEKPNAEGGGRLRNWLRQRARRRGLARFMIRSGFARLLDADDIERMAKEAGVEIVVLQCRRDAQPYFVARQL